MSDRKEYSLKDYSDALDCRKLQGKFNSARADKGVAFAAERMHALKALAGAKPGALRMGTPQSLKLAMLQLARMGLSLDPVTGHAYLLIRSNALYCSPSYRGLRYLAMLSPEIANIQCELVCENDPDFEQGMDQSGPYVSHKVARKERGEVTHAYCVTWFSNGTRQVEVMDRRDLDRVRDAAAKANRGSVPYTWMQWEGEMQKKSVARRGSKHWPISSSRLTSAIEAMNHAEPVLPLTTVTDRELKALEKLADRVGDEDLATILAVFGVKELSELPKDAAPAAKNLLKGKAL